MSDSQQAGRKRKQPRGKSKAVKEEKSVTLDEVFGEPEQVTRPEPVPETVKEKATPKEPVVVVDIPKLLRWMARLKTSGSFGAWGNGANFANHVVRDSFTIDGKELTIEEASAMINEFTTVQH